MSWWTDTRDLINPWQSAEKMKDSPAKWSRDALNAITFGLNKKLGEKARDKVAKDKANYDKREEHLSELKDYIGSYQDKLSQSNEQIPDNVRDLYDKLKKDSSSEPNSYRFNDKMDSGSIGEMEARFSSRYNRSNTPQNMSTKGQQLSRELTYNNNSNRINRGLELAEDKNAYDTYSNLFSQYIGKLNAESAGKENRVLSVEKNQHDQYFKLSKTLLDAQREADIKKDSFIGKGIDWVGKHL